MKILACPWLVSLHCIGIYQFTRTHRDRWPPGYYQFLAMPADTCCRGTLSPGWQSGPSSAGGKASAEWEVYLRVLVLSPGTKGHHDGSAVVFGTILQCLQKPGERERQRAGVVGRLCRQTASFLQKVDLFYTDNKCNYLTQFATVSILHLCSTMVINCMWIIDDPTISYPPL